MPLKIQNRREESRKNYHSKNPNFWRNSKRLHRFIRSRRKLKIRKKRSILCVGRKLLTTGVRKETSRNLTTVFRIGIVRNQQICCHQLQRRIRKNKKKMILLKLSLRPKTEVRGRLRLTIEQKTLKVQMTTTWMNLR